MKDISKSMKLNDLNKEVNMNTYQKAKVRAVDKAVEWQASFCEQSYSYGELAYWQDYFSRLARRYGLVREFRENGII